MNRNAQIGTKCFLVAVIDSCTVNSAYLLNMAPWVQFDQILLGVTCQHQPTIQMLLNPDWYVKYDSTSV